MRVLIILAVLLGLLMTVFAVQNIAPSAIQFLFWNETGSLALVPMVTFSVGILIGPMMMIPGAVRGRFQSAGLRRSIKSLEARLAKAQQMVATTSTPPLETGDTDADKG